MQAEIFKHIPTKSHALVKRLLDEDNLIVKVKTERKTRHGDYRQLPNGKHLITINCTLNRYQFLITLVHEIAHFEAYRTHGKLIKPHGKQWKQTFQYLMLPFLSPDIFPAALLPLLARHFKNPKASSDTDTQLALALKQFNEVNNKTYVFEVPLGKDFKLYNGRIFNKGTKRRKRFECMEVKTGKLYLFNPNAEVELMPLKTEIR
ncbi:MAG: SprT-like domain-containing protein [Winogradskyella sp.]